QSLLTTVFVAYLAALVFSGCATPIAALLGLLIALLIEIVGAYLHIEMGGLPGAFSSYSVSFQIGLVIAMVISIWIAPRLFLRWAQQWVGYRERTRHWEDEPRRPRRMSKRRGTTRR